jgi:hypothetical protein
MSGVAWYVQGIELMACKVEATYRMLINCFINCRLKSPYKLRSVAARLCGPRRARPFKFIGDESTSRVGW